MRKFAIINTYKNNDLLKDIISKLPNEADITVFQVNNAVDTPNGVKSIVIPEEFTENEPKIRNYVSKHYLESYRDGFLHVISGNVTIDNDPNRFLEAIEEMMKKLNQKSWFNCSCDAVNYIYSRFNPRFSLDIDDEIAKNNYDKTILLASNANTAWICYDMSKVEFEDMRLEEKFSVAMFYIIDFLARRRNTKKPGEFYYMNMYPTVEEELNVFSLNDAENIFQLTGDREKNVMQKEDAMFKEMRINFAPDHDIVQISEDLRNILS